MKRLLSHQNADFALSGLKQTPSHAPLLRAQFSAARRDSFYRGDAFADEEYVKEEKMENVNAVSEESTYFRQESLPEQHLGLESEFMNEPNQDFGESDNPFQAQEDPEAALENLKQIHPLLRPAESPEHTIKYQSSEPQVDRLPSFSLRPEFANEAVKDSDEPHNIIKLDAKKLGKLRKTKSSISKRNNKFCKKRKTRLIKGKSVRVPRVVKPKSPKVAEPSVRVENTQESTNQEKEELSDANLDKRLGPISHKERSEKIYKFLLKKYRRHTSQKYTYKCRQDVAEKRLRIKGRFVTREQAFEILGLTQDELKSNEIIQKLLENHSVQVNTLVESKDENQKDQRIKIRNFQALVDNNYSHKQQPRAAAPEQESFLPPSEQEEVNQRMEEMQEAVNSKDAVQLQLRISKRISQVAEVGKSNVTVSNMTEYHDIANNKELQECMRSLNFEAYIQPIWRVEKEER